MKQIVIRAIPGIPTVFDFIVGRLDNGEFRTSQIDDANFPIPPYVHDSRLLGTQAYVESTDLTALFCFYCIRASNIQFLPGYIVFTLDPDDYESKENSKE